MLEIADFMKRAEFKSLIDLNDYSRNETKCIQYFIKSWNGHIVTFIGATFLFYCISYIKNLDCKTSILNREVLLNCVVISIEKFNIA